MKMIHLFEHQRRFWESQADAEPL